MDPVKARTSTPVKEPEAPKRAVKPEAQEAKPDAVATQKATEQAQRPTTNTRGETLGRLLNVSA